MTCGNMRVVRSVIKALFSSSSPCDVAQGNNNVIKIKQRGLRIDT